MRFVDTTDNVRIPVLLELVEELQRLGEPAALLETMTRMMRRAYGPNGFVQLSTQGLGAGEYRVVRLLTLDGREAVPQRFGEAMAQAPVRKGGFLGRLVLRGLPSVAHDVDLSDDEAIGDLLAPYHSLIAIPLADGPAGNWVVILHPGAETFKVSDLEEAILRSSLTGVMIKNLHIARQLAAANARIAREIDAIAQIQRALLPETIPQIPGVQIGASYKTFDRAGGDIYDVARLGDRMHHWHCDLDGRWALLIGDVSGHGPAAAVVMAMFHSIMHAYPYKPAGPGEVLTHVNRHLCAKQIEQNFVTAFLAFYDPRTRVLQYARAGHNPPVVKQFPHAGEPDLLDAVGELPLGIMVDVDYSERSYQLRPGQTLILYTDGITEAMKQGGEMFGVEGITRSLVHCTGEPHCAISHINDALLAHQDGTMLGDDQTIVAMQVL